MADSAMTPDPADVIASESDARHPMLDGAPVMIGDILVADHPDDPDHHIEFHVGSLMYDNGRDLGSDIDRGWTVTPINIEFEDDAPYEWPLSECKRVSAPGYRIVPVVDDATRQEVEKLIEAIKAMRPDPSEPAPPGWDADDREGDRNVYRAADLLAAAYLPPPRLTDASYSGRTYK